MKILLVILISLNITVCFAQRDTTGLTQKADNVKSSPSLTDDHTPSLQHNVSFTQENTEKISIHEIPPMLRKTLEAPGEYAGWENGQFYRNIQTNEFRMELVNGQKHDVYYFDQDGKRIHSQ